MSGALAGIEDETLPNGSLRREAHPVDKKSIFGAGELNNRRSLARGHETCPIWCRERPAKQRDVRIDGAGLWSAKTKIVVKPPPSPGDTHDASRQAPKSSQPGNPRATCVCGRWPEHYPGGVPEFQNLMRSAVGPDCNAVPIL